MSQRQVSMCCSHKAATLRTPHALFPAFSHPCCLCLTSHLLSLCVCFSSLRYHTVTTAPNLYVPYVTWPCISPLNSAHTAKHPCAASPSYNTSPWTNSCSCLLRDLHQLRVISPLFLPPPLVRSLSPLSLRPPLLLLILPLPISLRYTHHVPNSNSKAYYYYNNSSNSNNCNKRKCKDILRI